MARKKQTACANIEPQVTLSKTDAYAILRLIEDIQDVNSRAGCSDRFFRTHFMDRIKSMSLFGIVENLRSAMAATERAQTDSEDGDA